MLQTFSYRGAKSWTVLAVALVSLFVSACGDSNDDVVYQNNGNNNNNPNLTYVGRFLGANSLDDGQTVVLDVTTNTSGTATGTIEAGILVQAVGGGNNTVSGSFDPNTGAFNLSGSLAGVGPLVISGNFPIGNGVGTYLLSINGVTFNGAIQNANLGVPAVPGGGGTGGTGTSDIIIGGSLSGFTFTPAGAYNGVNPPVSTGSLISGTVTQFPTGENVVGINLSETFVDGNPAKVRVLGFGIVLPDGEQVTVGQTYQVATSTTSKGAYVSLSESTGTTVERAWTLTPSTTGSATVTSLTSTSVELDFQFSTVGPNTAVANNTATGTFNTSGRVRGNFAPKAP